ncbi:hypothetical protein [Borrelia persica]|uniref:hypothetical protein n=1 Tax=Borrelia persica TaxID=44448 RepID=UPI0004BA42EE|nr:hypothetical protein [Borrelia persica]
MGIYKDNLIQFSSDTKITIFEDYFNKILYRALERNAKACDLKSQFSIVKS